MSDVTSVLFTSQQHSADSRAACHPHSLDSQHFDVAAELTAANASIHDGRLAQLTPSILRSSDTAFSYPFHQGGPALHGQPYDFNPALQVEPLPIQPFTSSAEDVQPNRNVLGPFVPLSEPAVSANVYSNTEPDLRSMYSVVPSTYGSYVAAFEVRELSTFTPNLKERLGNIVGSAHDAWQDLLAEMTEEFRAVLDILRDLANNEETKDNESMLGQFTNDRGFQPADVSSSTQTTNHLSRDQDVNWRASMLRGIHRRRDLVVQHLNLLSKSRMVGILEPGPYMLRKLNYGPEASFLDCLRIEKGEWERLWEILHVECEKVRLTKERMSTLARLWGVQIDVLEEPRFWSSIG